MSKVLLHRKKGPSWLFTKEFNPGEDNPGTGYVYRTPKNLYVLFFDDEGGYWVGRYFEDAGPNDSKIRGFQPVTFKIGAMSLEWPGGVWAWY